MQNSFLKTLKKSVCLLAAAAMMSTAVSCSDDDEPKLIPEAESFAGTLVTTIPAMPDFQAVESEVEVDVIWSDADQTTATIVVGAFTIETGMVGRDYAIGSMTIEGAKCQKTSGGSIVFGDQSFSCQAGDYATTGSVKGDLTNGTLDLTLIYRPGSMPFDVQSIFTGK